jgi:hypothetical protein
MRATIIVAVESREEVAAAKAWFARWKADLSYCSDVQGCGCCVEMWDVDGPKGAIAEIPYMLRAASEWSEPELFGPEFDGAAQPGTSRKQQRRRRRG